MEHSKVAWFTEHIITAILVYQEVEGQRPGVVMVGPRAYARLERELAWKDLKWTGKQLRLRPLEIHGVKIVRSVVPGWGVHE